MEDAQQQYYPAQRKIEVHKGQNTSLISNRPVLSEEESAHRMENVKREVANLMICYFKQKGEKGTKEE